MKGIALPVMACLLLLLAGCSVPFARSEQDKIDSYQAFADDVTAMGKRLVEAELNNDLFFDLEWRTETIKIIRKAEESGKLAASDWPERPALKQAVEGLRILSKAYEDYDLAGVQAAIRVMGQAGRDLDGQMR